MGSVKKALNKVTGRDKAKEEAERARREAEEQARKQAELDAAQKAQQGNEANAGAEDTGSDVEKQKDSAKKKTLKGGRKGLTVARSGGSGINV